MNSNLACPVQRECGGCPWMPLSSEAQRARKLARVEALLHERGLVPAGIELRGARHPYGYRNRIRLKVDPERGVRFFNEHKDPGCAVLEPELLARLTELRERSRRAEAPFAPFPHLELRGPDDLGRPGIGLAAPRSERAGEARESARRVAELFPDTLVGVHGDPDIPLQRRRIVDGVTALVPLDAFLQVNTAVNAALVSALVDGAVERDAKHALDLYSGAGNFSLPLAAAGLEVTAVELQTSAAAAQARAAAEQCLPCESLAEGALPATARLAQAGRRYDLVLVDAPRAGARDVTHAVAELGPRHVAVCSCNAATFARDAEALVRAGYALTGVHVFDMFPHTEHVEILAWFETALCHGGGPA